MNDTQILERITADGVTLSVSPDGNIDIDGDEQKVDSWMETIRENKSTILAELMLTQAIGVVTVTTPDPVTVTGEPTDSKYSATVTDASTDPVLVEVTIAGQASFTLEIPHKLYDGIALLELLEQHNIQSLSVHQST